MFQPSLSTMNRYLLTTICDIYVNIDGTNLFVLKLPLYHLLVSMSLKLSSYFCHSPFHQASASKLPLSNPSYHLQQDSRSLNSLSSYAPMPITLKALKSSYDNIHTVMSVSSMIWYHLQRSHPHLLRAPPIVLCPVGLPGGDIVYLLPTFQGPP